MSVSRLVGNSVSLFAKQESDNPSPSHRVKDEMWVFIRGLHWKRRACFSDAITVCQLSSGSIRVVAVDYLLYIFQLLSEKTGASPRSHPS